MAKSDFLASLNEKQLLATKHLLGPALVLAGAGSGKTRVLTSRVAHLLATNQAKPEEILLVTFTNKAAAEMKNRVRQLTDLDLPFSGTFHSLGVRILRQHAPLVNLDHNFTIYDSDDQLALLKQIYKDQGWDSKNYKPQLVKAMISQAKNFLQTPASYRQTAYSDLAVFVANAYEVYQRALARETALDFDDLLNFTLALLQENKGVRQRYQEQIKFVLIDEYQDTNQAQYQLSKILAAPQNNLFVVGDFSQSIYAWRGADYKNMLSLKKDYPDLTTYHLDQNYRSHQSILTAATQIIQKNTNHPILNLWTDNKIKNKIHLVEAETGNQEADYVAHKISQLQNDYRLSEIAILYRTNAQSRAFEEALTRYRLPYHLIGGFKFYERKEIKDLLAYLRLYFNHKESVSQQRLNKVGKRRFNAYLDWRTTYQQKDKKDEKPLTLLQEILRATKYQDLYDPTDPEEAMKLENINELLSHSSQFADSQQFLENIALIQDDYLPDQPLDVSATQKERVTLMSLHSAKGLEFGIVFLVGMEENLLPHARSLFDAEQLSEERRLCYVGITRAKHELYFTCARRRWQYGFTTAVCRSRFLDDLSANILIVERLEETAEPKFAFSSRWQKRDQRAQFSSPAQKSTTSRERRVVPDEDLEAVLHGDLDFETFLRS